MSDGDYRTAHGFVFAGPWEKTATTGQGVKKITTYVMSAAGLNGDSRISLDFWESVGPVPEYVQIGAAVLVNGTFRTYEGKDKDGNAETKKSINVSKCVHLGQNDLNSKGGGKQPAPKRGPREKAPEADLDDLLGDL